MFLFKVLQTNFYFRQGSCPQKLLPWRAFKNWLLGPIPRVSDSVGLKWGLRICISNKCPVMPVRLVWDVRNTIQNIILLSSGSLHPFPGNPAYSPPPGGNDCFVFLCAYIVNILNLFLGNSIYENPRLKKKIN